jgi:hypothetical protein
MSKVFFILIGIIFVGFTYGIFVGHYEIFPYDFITNVKQSLNGNPQIPENTFQIYEDPNDIENFLRINSVDDIKNKRINLYQYIWFQNFLPTTLPDSINYDVEDNSFDDLNNLKRIDKFTINMDYGINSIPYLFLAENSNDNLIIYHQGHGEKNYYDDKEIIQSFLNRGYSVLIFSMILNGINNEPIVDIENFGNIKFTSHNHLKFLKSSSFHPIKFFVEPISVTLNLMDEKYDFNSYHMVGLSGGGWTTSVYSALDARITKSFSIAGSFPILFRSDYKNFGDYEQTIPDFLRISNYLELYLIGSYGENRKSVQIFISSDPCCFPAQLYEKYPYEEIITKRLYLLGTGEFNVIIDNSTKKHELSSVILNKILNELDI